jgi:hypothetical protein
VGVIAGRLQFRLRFFIELFVSAIKVLSRSAAHTLALVPVLVVIVLLSLFAEELWNVLGNLSTYKMIAASALLGAPAALLMFASLTDTVKAITDSRLSRDELAHLAESSPLLNDLIQLLVENSRIGRIPFLIGFNLVANHMR